LDRALPVFEEALRLGEDRLAPIGLASTCLNLNRVAEAKRALARTRSPDSLALHLLQFQIAFLEGDNAALAEQVEWARERPEESFVLKYEADAAVFSGKMRTARELTLRAIESARRREMSEAASDFATTLARTQALVGERAPAVESAAAQLAQPLDWQSMARAATALALSGDAKGAQPFCEQIALRVPRGTAAHGRVLPLLRAAINLARGDARAALLALERAAPFERIAAFWPQYLRGQAHLLLRNGADASADFQAIIDHRARGILSPLYPLAHLGLARARVLADDTDGGRKAYQDFFAIWKDADPDVPLLQEARREFQMLPRK
jgi:eukaryotic-like serine/threonine-protein kinase